jgi:hypothetical protein
MTTHPSQSLPSFAQAFSDRSLSNMGPGNNALPPIHAHHPPMDTHPRSLSRPGSDDDVARTAGRKRPHTDIISGSREDVSPDQEYVLYFSLPFSSLAPTLPLMLLPHSRDSPSAVRVKEENDQDMVDASPAPQDQASERLQQNPDHLGAPTPSSTMPSPMKRRRMTVTGAPHALNIDVRVPPAEANSTPISPVVMGFTLPRDNPKEIEQVKSMISVKQKQKALIEQRRGSLAAPAPPNSGPPPSSTESASSAKGQQPGPLRGTRRSPNGGASTRRVTTSTINRLPSPGASTFAQQQTIPLSHQSAQTLPPPPISFARRRAAQMGKRKPADIVINPREQRSPEHFQLSIQSAPPTQSTFYSGRVALPSLPNVMGRADTSTAKRPAGNVPPTPTRLTQRMNPSAPTIHVGEGGPRSPLPSVPIASTLVPPTPAFHQTEHSNGDKAAFLAPFAMFYESLNDAKQLKTWLGEQLQRSNTLFQNLSQQQDRIQDTVESIVDRRLASVHTEMSGLRRRVLELEDALRDAQSGHRGTVDVGPLYHTKSLQNGYSSSHLAPDSYTFPPTSSDHSRLRSDLSGRVSSPRGHERDGRGMQHESERDSSVPYDSRRSTASALRLDPPRPHHDPSPLPPTSHSRMSHNMQSPPQMYRDSPPTHHSLPPPPPPPGKVPRGGYSERPPLSRQTSHGGSQDRDRDREHGESSMPSRRPGSRRNSIDQRMEDS